MTSPGTGREATNCGYNVRWMDSHPGLWTCQSLVQEMTSILPEVPDGHGAWTQVLSNLSMVPISRLQRFWIYAKRRGFHGRDAGPAWEMQETRALAAASLGMQRSAGGSKRGLDHLQQWRLEQEGFLNATLEALTPLLEAAQSLRSFIAKAVASIRNVAGIAFFYSFGALARSNPSSRLSCRLQTCRRNNT